MNSNVERIAFPPLGRGATMVEVLVTLILVSVGLLGVAALQLTSLRSSQEAGIRARASVLAADVLDRMRANATAVRGGEYDVDYNETGTAGSTSGNDLSFWQSQIDQLLPGGPSTAAGRIERDAATNIVTITIRWNERAEEATSRDAEDVTFQTRSEI